MKSKKNGAGTFCWNETIQKLTTDEYKSAEVERPEDKSAELRRQITEIMQDPEKCAALMDEFAKQLCSDDEPPEKAGYYLMKAYLDGSVDDVLIAVCGWSMRSLLARSGLIPDTEGVLG